jgi:hypothetical protein
MAVGAESPVILCPLRSSMRCGLHAPIVASWPHSSLLRGAFLVFGITADTDTHNSPVAVARMAGSRSLGVRDRDDAHGRVARPRRPTGNGIVDTRSPIVTSKSFGRHGTTTRRRTSRRDAM